MAIPKPHNISHYWKLEGERQIILAEAEKQANLIRSKGLEQARAIGKMEREWRHLKKRLAKLNTVLDPYKVKNVPIEIVREG